MTGLTPHVMVDLETLGSTPGAAIVSIGAVAFDPHTGLTGRSFYRIVDPGSCQALGLTLDAGTVKWWLTQNEAARRAIAEAGDPLPVVLQHFSFWWQEVDGRFFWSHGANFDEPVLGAAYRAAGHQTPWRYSASRCTRTIFDLADVAIDRSQGDHHNALDDAIAQAAAVVEAYRKLGLAKAQP